MLFKWETLSEINNDYFNIEQLVGDDIIVIGTIAGSGTISYTSEYEFEYPLTPGCFRLTQVDYDGKSVSYDFIYNHIKNLRKKITKAGGKNYIKAMYGMGYKFSTHT